MQLFWEYFHLEGAFLINIGAIKNISRVKKCSQGTTITGNGIGNVLFITLKGEVGVYVNYKQPGCEMVSTLGSGDLFADSGLLQDKKAAYTTVALSDAIIVPISKNSFNEFLLDEPALAFELIKDLCLRLEHASSAYKDLIIHHDGAQRHRDKKPDRKNPEEKQPTVPVTISTPEVSPEKNTEASSFKLFPDEHHNYSLLLKNDDTAHLMTKSHTCPICRGAFSALTVKPSKLVLASTDRDMRSRYKEIEPLYYEVLTCPHCLFSALPDVFNIPDKSKPDIKRALESIKNSVRIGQPADLDTNSVFAGFYLALFCAPISFVKNQLVCGKLLYKLSRVYQDTGDTNMEILTAKNALDNYLYAYENIGITPSQEQQICILIGELHLKLNDLKNAISFFTKARMSTSSTPVLKSHAENRIYDIRDMVAAQK